MLIYVSKAEHNIPKNNKDVYRNNKEFSNPSNLNFYSSSLIGKILIAIADCLLIESNF